MPNQLPLSAVLITLNAEARLENTLESLKFCSDLVVVDSGSKDRTLEIARRYGARIFYQEWTGFGPQKRFAVEQAQYNWVLCLDADEEVSQPLLQEIESLFKGSIDTGIAGFEFPRCNAFLGRFLRHGEGYPDYSKRLFHRLRAQWTHDEVHERVEATQGLPFNKLKGDLMHHSAECLSTYMTKQNRYTDLQASDLADRGKWPSALKLAGSPLIRFIKFYFVRLGFLDGWQGFVHISIGCFNSFMKYAKTRALMAKLPHDEETSEK